jgi:hypothetical protein
MRYEMRPRSFTEILGAAVRIVSDHFVLLVGTAAVGWVPLALLLNVGDSETVSPHWVSAAILLLLSIGLAQIGMAALPRAVGEICLGRVTTIGDGLRAVLRIIVPVSLTGLMEVLLVGLGFVLLIVPGVYLTYVWLLSPQVMLFERRFYGAALARSRMLMRANLVRALGILVIGGLIPSMVGGLLQVVLSEAPVLGTVVVELVDIVGITYGATVSTLLYFDIRCRRESFDLEHLARLVYAGGSPPPPSAAASP